MNSSRKCLLRIDGGELAVERDQILCQLKCRPGSAEYEECLKEYEALLPKLRELPEPRAAFGLFEYPSSLSGGALKGGASVIYMIATVGRKLSVFSESCFAGGDYVKGLLADAYASAGLFAFEKRVLKSLREFCREEEIGILRRLEAPEDLPMEVQNLAFEGLEAKDSLGISLSSGLMFDPVKTSCLVFEVTDDANIMKLFHDCSSCSAPDCPNRSDTVTVRVEKPGRASVEKYEFSAEAGDNLMELLRENGIPVNALCGGAGRCGKCAVRLLEGELPVTAADKAYFKPEELESGARLSCTAEVRSDIRVRLLRQTEEKIRALGADPGFKRDISKEPGAGKGYGIAADIGTTTIALSLVELSPGEVVDTVTMLNSQRKFGADVLTRIDEANKGRAEELRQCVLRDLIRGSLSLCERNGILAGKPERMVITGNTTMLHLLLKYPVRDLGTWPFKPYSLAMTERGFGELVGEKGKCSGEGTAEGLEKLCKLNTVILPGISAFVGADIVSGLYECGFEEREKTAAFIDLGTNAEMAVGNKNKLLVASAAAGPAFEGGNIKFGVGSIDGAISSVNIRNAGSGGDCLIDIKTINDAPVTGICGTGVIEAVSELRRMRLMDETGMLSEAYFDTGFPLAEMENGGTALLTQKDIRELQLAKSAIRAGFETLLERFGVGVGELDRVFLSGGFGHFLDPAKAAAIGMFPEEVPAISVPCGNTALLGAIRFLLDQGEGKKAVDHLSSLAKECPLAEDTLFGELYMKYMGF